MPSSTTCFFSVGPKDRVEHSLATNEGRIPLRFSDLKEILKANTLAGKQLNKVVWEALGLSEAERLSHWEAAKAEHARVNVERENAHNRQKDAERAALMTKVQKASDLVRKGEAVSGPDLISLCQELGIKINPGTRGGLEVVLKDLRQRGHERQGHEKSGGF